MKNMKPELVDEMDGEERVPAVKFRCRHYRETRAHDGAVARRANGSPDEGFRIPPPEPCCFVCGLAVNDSGWFARMFIPGRTLSLCSASCSLMFFEAEEVPAHDHRARHNFQRARAAILAAAKDAMQTPKRPVQFTLLDGTHVLLRPVMPEDQERIQNGMAALSPGSRYFRFFTSAARLSDEQLRYFSEVDQCNHVAWVALDSSDPEHPGLGVARFIRIKAEPTVAEVALTVIDAYQCRGLGTILLALLYLIAGRQGFQTLRAAVVGENTTMLKWFHNLGAVGSCERGEYRLNLTVHRDLAHLPQTPSGEKFKHAIEAVQTAFYEHHTYEKQT